jgi:hypothetical protein
MFLEIALWSIFRQYHLQHQRSDIRKILRTENTQCNALFFLKQKKLMIDSDSEEVEVLQCQLHSAIELGSQYMLKAARSKEKIRMQGLQIHQLKTMLQSPTNQVDMGGFKETIKRLTGTDINPVFFVFNQLGEGVIKELLSLLSMRDVLNLSSTCKYFRSKITEPKPSILSSLISDELSSILNYLEKDSYPFELLLINLHWKNTLTLRDLVIQNLQLSFSSYDEHKKSNLILKKYFFNLIH